MDTTKQYIKMCEKATEIQALLHTVHTSGSFISDGVVIYIGSCRMAPDVWLPRQDQLQEMVRGRNPIPAALLWDFARWEDDASFSRYGLKSWEDLSFEMLWLAYVMYKLHNKVWNGTDWIKE